MKKKIFLIAIVGLTGCQRASVVKIEKLPSKECIYTVQDSVNYTFIDSCGKYALGQTIK